MVQIVKNIEEIDVVIDELKKNRCVILPTETVYGIGGNALSEEAVENIFAVKERKKSNPLNVLISDFSMLDMLAKEVTEEEKKIMQAFWPGPLTIILPKKDTVPSIVTAGSSFVGVRIPDQDVTRKIIRKANMPLACPSANISGKPSGTMVEDVQVEFANKVKYIVDGGISSLGIESTVLRVIDKKAVIMRPGFVTKEDIEALGIEAVYAENLAESQKAPHYIPDVKCILARKDARDTVKVILEKAKEEEEKKIIVLATHKNVNKYVAKNIIEVIDMGEEMQIAKNIFHILRNLANKNADLVIIEGVEEKGAMLAVMNRITKACNNICI